MGATAELAGLAVPGGLGSVRWFLRRHFPLDEYSPLVFLAGMLVLLVVVIYFKGEPPVR